MPSPESFAALARALQIPVARLLTDELVLAEVRVSEETLLDVRRRGAPAAREAALRLASSLEPLLLAEATRPPVYVGPGAQARRRRTREQVLAGLADLATHQAAKKAREKDAGRIE